MRELYRTLSSDLQEATFPKDVYLYISRRAVTVSAIESEADIIYIVNRELKKTVGDLRNRLEQHLGIPFSKEDSVLVRSLMDINDDEDKKEIVKRVLHFKKRNSEQCDSGKGGISPVPERS